MHSDYSVPVQRTGVIHDVRRNRMTHELAALGLVAFSIYIFISLVSLDAGRDPNLGGPLGSLLAGTLEWLFGFQAYMLAALIACLAWPVWVEMPLCTLLRETAGGILLLLSLVVAAGFWTIGSVAPGGAAGAAIAGALRSRLDFGGGYLVVMLALVGALALIAGRAPTELAAALAELASKRPRKGDPPEVHRSQANTSAGPDPTPLSSGWQSSRILTPVENSATSTAQTQPRPLAAHESHKLPPLDLLDEPPLEHAKFDETALQQSAQLLEQKLSGFGVQGHVVEVQPGPVVTMYKVQPGEGVKVSQIVNLADDLSLALRAATVRILAPVPGEAVVGIEVPNRRREKVYLREILEAQEYKQSPSRLAIALGKDIAGTPVAADLALMPHLLIAGATGSGKSVSIHTMIASILFKATADEVRFILIDPKMLELSVYEGIPHLLVPVVVDPEKAAAALVWATGEMETRYRLMRELGVRNIDGYNRLIGQNGELVELRRGTSTENSNDSPEWVDTPVKHRRLPKIVIVIDELADLLLSEGKTVERDITRLAQKARAAGIHLILATQRPSVDVITGLIKANLPARISLQVTSRVDSRTILDSIGAERLLGAGDMLFLPPGTAKLRRLHGPFVSEAEIRRVCDFLRAQGAPDYRMEILETPTRPEGDGLRAADERDELYDQALQIVLESGQASISMIQRRLRIGYNRSARIVEQMERDGIVTPPDGARPRELRIRGAN